MQKLRTAIIAKEKSENQISNANQFEELSN